MQPCGWRVISAVVPSMAGTQLKHARSLHTLWATLHSHLSLHIPRCLLPEQLVAAAAYCYAHGLSSCRLASCGPSCTSKQTSGSELPAIRRCYTRHRGQQQYTMHAEPGSRPQHRKSMHGPLHLHAPSPVLHPPTATWSHAWRRPAAHVLHGHHVASWLAAAHAVKGHAATAATSAAASSHAAAAAAAHHHGWHASAAHAARATHGTSATHAAARAHGAAPATAAHGPRHPRLKLLPHLAVIVADGCHIWRRKALFLVVTHSGADIPAANKRARRQRVHRAKGEEGMAIKFAASWVHMSEARKGLPSPALQERII